MKLDLYCNLIFIFPHSPFSGGNSCHTYASFDKVDYIFSYFSFNCDER
jgi:hypothetical protein